MSKAMRCKACWREAKRMAKRGGTPRNAMLRITKRIYLDHHITTTTVADKEPEWLKEFRSEPETEGCRRHIKASGYRRHSNGKVIALAATQNRS